MPKAIFKVEVSHHEGYCTGDECEYDCWEEEHEVWTLEDRQIEIMTVEIQERKECVMDRDNPSHYCSQDDKSTKKGIGKHQGIVTFVDMVPQTKVSRSS